MNLGYHKIFLIINRFLDIHNSFLDIQKSIYGYPKIYFWISKNHAELIFGYP